MTSGSIKLSRGMDEGGVSCGTMAILDEGEPSGIAPEELERGAGIATEELEHGVLNVDLFPVPVEGQEFNSQTEAHNYYHNFALQNGFSVRKGNLVWGKNNGNPIPKAQIFVCHKEGVTPLTKVQRSEEYERERKRSSTRERCKAKMRIARVEAEGGAKWKVVSFCNVHTHPLLTEAQTKFLPAYRRMEASDRDRILRLKRAGLRLGDIMSVLMVDKGTEELGFLKEDVKNFLATATNTESQSGHDTTELLKILKDKSDRDGDFSYDFTVDEDGRLENIFWIHGKARMAYQRFGDCVVFDTTYKLNRYHMPFAMFIGVNNHGQSILFGAALLRKENVETFQWLFSRWRITMGGSPVSILTDQDGAMGKAIQIELPTTVHAFCLWHIARKFPGWFSTLIGKKFPEFMTDFYAILEEETAELFEGSWELVITEYGLEDNSHILDLYECRHHWAPVYLRDTFFANMNTTQRSESMNAFVNSYLNVQTKLSDFVCQFDKAIDSRTTAAFVADMRDRTSFDPLKTATVMERYARKKLTTYAFRLFQDQLVQSAEYVFNDGFVRHYQHEKENRTITWDPNNQIVICSCKMFEFSGILCRHGIKALTHFGVVVLPDHYLLKRWHRDPDPVSIQREFIDYHQQSIGEVADMVQWRNVFLMETRMVLDHVKDERTKGIASRGITAIFNELIGEASTKKTLQERDPTMLASTKQSITGGDSKAKTVVTDVEVQVENPPRVKTKGRPKGSRLKAPFEKIAKKTNVPNLRATTSKTYIARKPRMCGACNKLVIGHNRRTCPENKSLPETPDCLGKQSMMEEMESGSTSGDMESNFDSEDPTPVPNNFEVSSSHSD